MKFSYMKRGAAAAIVAGTLAFAPVAAMAQTVPASSAADQVVVNKTWTAASKTQLNNTEVFQFKLKYKDAQKVGSNDCADLSSFDKTVDLEANWLENATDNSSSATLSATDLFGDQDFAKPGIYNFTLEELLGSNNNIVYSNAKYTVTVNVGWSDNYPDTDDTVIKSITVCDADGKKGDASFKNDAKANDSLKVSKTVAGTAANTNDEFSYKLRIEGATGSYDVVKSNGKKVAQVEAGKDYDFTLKHGESIEVKNLPEGATYTVTEAENDYIPTNKVNGSDSKNGLVATGTIAKKNEVAYKNEKGFVPATGITMNTLPFVGIGVVAVAGAATLVISRRRRSGEEF